MSMNFNEDDDDDEEMAEAIAASRKRPHPSTDGGESSSTGALLAAASVPSFTNRSRRSTAAGAIDFCPSCDKRFTVTAYTKHTDQGGLCHKCGPLHGKAKAAGGALSGTDLVTSAAVEGAKRAKPRRKPNQLAFDAAKFPTLQSLCINIIANNIEHVEALIGVGGQNMDKISKSIAKNRRLTSRTMLLFLQPTLKQLAFYDCSQLDSDSLASIPRFCPDLEEINLQLCGMLDNDVVEKWATQLTKLRKVELYGPYLVYVAAWHKFFEIMAGRLTSFKIRESPRFDKGCCEKLVQCCPNLQELGLAQIGPLNGECLDILATYAEQLTYVDISDPGVSAPGVPPKSLEDDAVVNFLKSTGKNLTHLNLSRNADLTSRVLLDGILASCTSLQALSLILFQSQEIQSLHFVQLFRGLKERGAAHLRQLDLERCLAVDDEVIQALVDFSGSSLVKLNINSCDKITELGLRTIAEGCPLIEFIDVGFCRQVTDAIVIDFINNMRHLLEVWLFSCNKITPMLNSTSVRIIGKEKYPRIL
jgi:DNA repair protein RAD7